MFPPTGWKRCRRKSRSLWSALNQSANDRDNGDYGGDGDDGGDGGDGGDGDDDDFDKKRSQLLPQGCSPM